MPAKSKKQFKKMFVLEKEGKISPKTRHEFTDTVEYDKLPSRVKPPRGKKHK